MQPETQQLIQTWYTVASGQEIRNIELNDSYFRFMAAWVAFNALYNSRPWASNKGDKEQVELFSKQDENQSRHCVLMKNAPEYRQAVQHLKKLVTSYRIRDEYDLKEVMNCVYRVRNNLFHGRKLPGNLEDKRLVEAGYVIVFNLMLIEPFLSEVQRTSLKPDHRGAG